MKKGVSDSVISLIVVIIVFIFILLILFNSLRAVSYSGRPQAKFAYALSGSVSFLVDKPSQVVSSIGTDGLIIAGGIIAAAAIVGGAIAAHNAEEDENLFNVFSAGAAGSIKSVLGNTAFEAFTGASAGLLITGDVFNSIASNIQQPILYYLALLDEQSVNLTELNSQDYVSMYQNLNSTYANYIEKKYSCESQPTSTQCENLYLTYRIAQDLYYTYGETLGQSVAIAGAHNEYFLAFFNYNDTEDKNQANITLNEVLCMLYMMDYYNVNPFNQMYGSQDINNLDPNENTDLACNITATVNNQLQFSGSGLPQNIQSMVAADSATLDTSDTSNGGQISLINYPNIIVQPQGSLTSGYIMFTYDGGTQAIIISSLLYTQN
ncbi:hypothetical protein MJ1_0042 [Nanobdella aerobiophila]|uniref:Uncharacterized protein n=1 Tax=Nanobdella aerobiophila TaxID=2586965 RepID=A0A915WRU8_9ARCH|nr:hypothetical protein [Nanobdella aerobiophila]BBL45221.1 hypothetical protein MJ1_0042 [Nanobdella aerobiophila]